MAMFNNPLAKFLNIYRLALLSQSEQLQLPHTAGPNPEELCGIRRVEAQALVSFKRSPGDSNVHPRV